MQIYAFIMLIAFIQISSPCFWFSAKTERELIYKTSKFTFESLSIWVDLDL